MVDIEPYIRPSALEQIALCAGAPLLQAIVVAQDGEPKTSEVAESGAYFHASVALSLSQRSRTLLALTTLTADDFTISCAERALRFAWDLIDHYQIAPENILVEHHLAAAGWGLPRGGTCDLALLIPFVKLWVIDWKAGYLDQGEAVDHAQLMGYGCAGAEMFKVQEVEVMLYQAREPKDKRVTRALFDAQALRDGMQWIKDVTYRAREQLTAWLNGMAIETAAGYAQCHYCKALSRCKTARQYMQDAIEALELIGCSTPAQWGDLAGAAKLAEQFAKASRELVKTHLAGGGKATGWQLTDGRAMTAIDPLLAMQLAQAAGELPRLLQFAKFSSDAADCIESISGAVTIGQSTPSLRPDKRSKA